MPVYVAVLVRLTRLREWRRRRGLTQAELGARVGLARYTISRLETGVEEPRPGTIRRLAAALDCRTDQLMERSPDS